MKKLIIHTVSILAFVLYTLAGMAQSINNDFVANQFYIKIIPPATNVSYDQIQYIPHPNNPEYGKTAWDIIKRHGGKSMVKAFNTDFIELQNVYKVTLKPGTDINNLIALLNGNEDVAYAERIPVYTIAAKPIDLDENKQWYFKTINMDNSWVNNVSPDFSRQKVIAIIDNGINYKHSDLQSSIAFNNGETAGDGIDNDTNGYIDDFFGWDVINNTGDPSAIEIDPLLRDKDQYKTFGWHGTHVAGIAGASSNDGGIASLGVNNKIVCIKAAGVVDGELSDHKLYNINEAFRYAITRKVDIINCSFGSRNPSIVTQSIINEARSKGILVVAAAGNLKSDVPFYPAAYDNVIAVGATDREDKVWKFSNYGAFIDVMAPGHEIYSTVSTDVHSFGYLSGTSMAAPIVAAFAGLILSNEPDRVDQIEEIIKGGCDNIDAQNPDRINQMGAGRINVDKSFEYLLNIDNPTSVVEVKHQAFNIYPNPASSKVYIPFLEISPSGKPVSVEIFNLSGLKVVQQNIASQSEALSVSQLSQGVYQIVVTTADGINHQSRLVVSH